MKWGPALWIVLLGIGFIAGLAHLFQLRFESGDVFPPYSSLRADPLGTKALHDSLEGLVEVRRQFSPLTRLGSGEHATLLHLGTDPASVWYPDDQWRALETFARSGGRLVFAFFPRQTAVRTNRFASTSGRTNGPAGSPGPNLDLHAPETRSLVERWRIRFAYEAPSTAPPEKGHALTTATRRFDQPSLPDSLSIHTRLYFESVDSGWRTLYARPVETNGEAAVIVERGLGRGSIVLMADTFPFSNEALRNDRQASLLAWVVGPSPTVIFDETHLGTRTDPGIAAMARRYRLHGLAAALVVLAGLFVWKNASSLRPVDEAITTDESAHQVAGKDATEGFVNLLRRNIPPREILRVCLQQWQAQGGARNRPGLAKLEAMQKLIDEQNALEPRRRDPVRTYQQFCAILTKRT